jgi:hypothetical protein
MRWTNHDPRQSRCRFKEGRDDLIGFPQRIVRRCALYRCAIGCCSLVEVVRWVELQAKSWMQRAPKVTDSERGVGIGSAEFHARSTNETWESGCLVPALWNERWPPSKCLSLFANMSLCRQLLMYNSFRYLGSSWLLFYKTCTISIRSGDVLRTVEFNFFFLACS